MLRQFLAFSGAGVIGTLCHYAALVALVQAGIAGPVAATTAGFVIGALVNYALNCRYTFTGMKPHREALPRFLLVAAAGAAFNAMLMHAGVAYTGAHYLAVQLFATAMVLVWNFLANRYWTFQAGATECTGPE